MSFWTLTQILINLLLLFSVVSLWIKLSKPAKDDPRLSKGLQLLQSKIAILEDLSDKSEEHVKQMLSLLDMKNREIQNKIEEAEKVLTQIEQSKNKSLEVAKIFQDKIPHKEIIERQNSLKYVQAAKMAHQGLTVEEISEKIDLPIGEVSLIVKMNRQKLNFDEAKLPDWAQEEHVDIAQESTLPKENKDSLKMDSLQNVDKKEALKSLGNMFRQVGSLEKNISTSKKSSVVRTVKFPVIEG